MTTHRRDLLRAGLAALGCAGGMRVWSAPAITGQTGATAPQPFRLSFGPERIHDLHRRIDATRWPRPAFDTGWSEGTHLGVLRDLVRYWRHEYDWVRVEEGLNTLPHFTLPLEGERLHFVWYRGSGPRQPFPLLLVHGWPATFLEFRAAAPLLMRGGPEQPGFDLVVPSLPGYGLSEAPRAPGMHPGRIAERLHTLMGHLGYRRYGVIGGDWGWPIGTALAGRHPDHVVGLQLHGAPWSPPQGRQPTSAEQLFLDRWARFLDEGRGYGHIQATRPQTLALALSDSPVGLLAWVLEKYWEWSDHGEDLWASLERDHVLTTVMLYWLPENVLSSGRLYSESRLRPVSDRPSAVTVPTAFAPYPADPWTPPKSLLDPKEYKNIVRYTEPPRGGHFPAMEEPEFWAEDARSFFSTLR